MAARSAVACPEPHHVLDQRGAIKRHEELFGQLVAPFTPQIERTLERLGHLTLHLAERIVLGRGLSVVAHLHCKRCNRSHQLAFVGENLIGQTQRMQLLHQIGALRRDHQFEPRLHKAAVKTDVDIGNPRHGGEPAIVFGIVLDDLADVVERAAFEARDIVAARELWIVRVGSLVLDDRFV